MDEIERFAVDIKTSIRICAVMQCRLIAHLAPTQSQIAPLESALAEFRTEPGHEQFELLTELLDRFEKAIAYAKTARQV